MPAPAAPGPSGPKTGGGGGGAGPVTGGGVPKAAAARGPTTRGGIPLDLERRKTSKERLKIRWDHVVPSVGEQPVPLAEALQRITHGDARPLLVLRECSACAGTDQAILHRNMTHERVVLLSHWFHCVRLPNHVIDATHPLHALFAEELPPHFYFLQPDGTGKVAFDGRQPQSKLLEAMLDVLRRSYVEDAGEAADRWARLLARFDHLDTLRESVQDQLDAEVERHGPGTALGNELRAQLAKVDADMTAALLKEQQLAKLTLRAPAAAR